MFVARPQRNTWPKNPTHLPALPTTKRRHTTISLRNASRPAWCVKAVREGKVQLTDGYVVIRDGELFLIGCQVNPLKTASTHVNPDSVRSKKLLLKKDDIRRLIVKAEQKGYTLVPLNLHWKNGKIKCEIALAKGKAEHDKRDTIKDREGKREVERAMKSRSR
jgi:SsrA-binding protein